MLIIVVLLACLVGAASAASVTVAASNSQVKSSAQYLCDGSNDQVEIQAAINQVAPTGGDVYLLDGTFTVAGTIKLASGVNLIGKGTGATTLNFVSEGWVQAYGNNAISNLQTTGATGFLIGGSHVRMTNVTVRNYTAKIAAFQVYAFNKALTDITFTTCNAIDGWSYGFLNAGEGSPNSVSDITYSGCSAINCGRASQYNPWITGFDLAESTDISNLLAEKCRAEGAWESGFHFEVTPMKNDVILKNCISINNGQKKNREEPNFGAGFLGGSSTLQFIDCTSQENIVGFRLADGATVIRGKDIGSIDAFSTTDHHTIVLTDCASDQARQWALHGLNSHDVIATNFIVTNPKGNKYPALLIDSSQYPSYNMNIQLGSVTTPTATPVQTTVSTTIPTNIPTTAPTTIVPTAVPTTISTTVAPTTTPIVNPAAPQALVAQFSASTTSGKTPLTVFFTDQSAGNPTSYAWKFGDGATSTARNPTHKYTKKGTYTVTEIIRSSAGSDTIVKKRYIRVR